MLYSYIERQETRIEHSRMHVCVFVYVTLLPYKLKSSIQIQLVPYTYIYRFKFKLENSIQLYKFIRGHFYTFTHTAIMSIFFYLSLKDVQYGGNWFVCTHTHTQAFILHTASKHEISNSKYQI